MTSSPTLTLGPYRYDPASESLWKGDEEIRLPPRSFAVLGVLLRGRGRVVTKSELLAAAWPGVVVGDAAIGFAIGEIRRALGDSARHPRFIETIHRRGYRMLAEAAIENAPATPRADQGWGPGDPAFGQVDGAAGPVGREAELARLLAMFDRAMSGRRTLVFLMGEAGIGKTTMVETFLARVRERALSLVARGECIEQYGQGEAYLPVLEALGRLVAPSVGSSTSDRARDVLIEHAPTWMLQLEPPGPTSDGRGPDRRLPNRGREEMLREIVVALEELAARQPLVLVLEDLHWSDHATVEMLMALSRRREDARLLVVGTCRPAETASADHPVRRLEADLLARGRAERLDLALLDAAAVAEYLTRRLPKLDADLVSAAASRIHAHTEGNALFMVSMVDHLLESGRRGEDASLRRWIDGRDPMAVPPTLRLILDGQVCVLPESDQALIEAASVVGATFSTTAVAALTTTPTEKVEEDLERLARRSSMLMADGIEVWPDGCRGTRYRFAHVLYAQVLYERVAEGRRIAMHRSLAERLETAHRPKPDTGRTAVEGATDRAASELAVHFERGHAPQRALTYRRLAADRALARDAHWEAAEHFARGLDDLEALEASAERRGHELALAAGLGASLVFSRGYASPEALAAFERADRLVGPEVSPGMRLQLLISLFAVVVARARFDQAWELGERMRALAAQADLPRALVWAEMVQGNVALYRGEFEQARRCFERARARPHAAAANETGAGFAEPLDPVLAAQADLATVLWYLGDPDGARTEMTQALEAAGNASVLSRSYVLGSDAQLSRLSGDTGAVLARCGDLLALADEYGLAHYRSRVLVLSNWARAVSSIDDDGSSEVRDGRGVEAIEALREAIETYRAAHGALLLSDFYLLLADAQAATSRFEDALACIELGLGTAADNQELFHQAELLRLRGEVRLAIAGRRAHPGLVADAADPATPAASADLQAAREVARRQGAAGWERRVEASLQRLQRLRSRQS